MTVTRGLEGVVATTSSISSIIDDTLTYVGYDIDDLAVNASFEEVIYLLWHRKLPTAEQLAELKKQLAENAALPQEVLNHFKTYPIEKVHPMAALRTAVSLLGFMMMKQILWMKKPTIVKQFAFRQKCQLLVTTFARIRKGLEPIAPRQDLSFAANFLYMLNW